MNREIFALNVTEICLVFVCFSCSGLFHVLLVLGQKLTRFFCSLTTQMFSYLLNAHFFFF